MLGIEFEVPKLGYLWISFTGAQNPDRVTQYNVFTTPFIVIDGELAFVGVPRESALDGLLSRRGDEQGSRRSGK